MASLEQFLKKRSEETTALLAEWGIDAKQIPESDWGIWGYKARSPWPDGFPIDKLIEIRGGVGI